MRMVKWPPEMQLEKSIGFADIEKPLTRYMQYNNFKKEEIDYIFIMLNTFAYVNKPYAVRHAEMCEEIQKVSDEISDGIYG